MQARGLFAAAAGTLVVGAATIAYLRYRDWLLQRKKHKSILVAACDLDKTMYPPAGANQASQPWSCQAASRRNQEYVRDGKATRVITTRAKNLGNCIFVLFGCL